MTGSIPGLDPSLSFAHTLQGQQQNSLTKPCLNLKVKRATNVVVGIEIGHW